MVHAGYDTLVAMSKIAVAADSGVSGEDFGLHMYTYHHYALDAGISSTGSCAHQLFVSSTVQWIYSGMWFSGAFLGWFQQLDSVGRRVVLPPGHAICSAWAWPVGTLLVEGSEPFK